MKKKIILTRDALIDIKAQEYERGLKDAQTKVFEGFVEKWADRFDGYAQNGQIIDIDLIKQMLKEAGVEVVKT